MADSTTASLDDIKASGSDFTFTGKLAEFAGNEDWINGYYSIIDGVTKRNDYSTMWEMLSAGTEECGNKIYKEIKSYINKIGNIDTCGLHALKNFANILNFKDDLVSADLSLPAELNGLVEIFSVNTAYLLNKSDLVVQIFALSNSILSGTSAEEFRSIILDRDKYKSFVSNVIYNTIFKFLTLKVGKFDDGKVEDYDQEIWRTNISRFTTELWNDDVTSDQSIYELKSELGVEKPFTEKIYADKVISGEKKLEDFSYEEQQVISAEIESRQTRYSDSNQMRYYFMRLYKVLEYFRFVTLTYRKIYELSEYDINSNKFVVNDVSDKFSIIKNAYTNYVIDTNIVRKVAEWLADFCINISYTRTRMKKQSQKNMMKGTKRLIVDAVREFISEQVDSSTWSNFKNSILFDANLNSNFDISLIEYTDNTEYFNIEKDTDVVDFQKNGLNPKYWEKYGDAANAFSKDEVLSFYNRVFDDKKKFVENDEYGDENTGTNLYEFLKLLFESGASSALNSDYFSTSEVLSATGSTNTSSITSTEISERTAEIFEKFSGDSEISNTFYNNIKNTFHPSYQIHPFVQGFEEYNAAYTSVMNLVNSFSDTIETSISRLADRIDKIGCTINFWYNWNEDFTGYSTNFEKGGSDSDSKLNQDSPFNFDALQEFITFPDEYILNILQGMNSYYISDLTGKQMFNKYELSLEIARLQKYRQDIIDVANKAIYKYAKDFYGNIYILYKDEDNRNNRNSLGNIWVRLKDHPIAFPLFDVSESSTPFGESSCLSDSDNEKLISVLKKVIRRFDSSYGLGNGYITTENLTLTFNSRTVSSMVVIDSNGYPTNGTSHTVENIVDKTSLRAIEPLNTAFDETLIDIGLKKLSDPDAKFASTTYFVDTVTNEAVGGTFVVSALIGGEYTTVDNTYGKILQVPSDEYLKATYENDVLTISRNISNRTSSASDTRHTYVTFADYTDEVVSESDVAYYYTNEYGITHPCSKRKIEIKKVYNIPADPNGETVLSGNVTENGNVDFGVWSESSENKAVKKINESIIDGVDIYEDFDYYTYVYGTDRKTYRYHPSMGAHDIVMIGGSNPFYIQRGADDNGNFTIELIRAERAVDAEPNTYVFKDGLYHNITGSVIMTSFPFSACECRVNNSYSDTIHQFQPKDNQYINCYPYTDITEPTLDASTLDSVMPSACITFKENNKTYKFYYNLKGYVKDHVTHQLSAKIITHETWSNVITSKNLQLGGNIELHTKDSSKQPITLTFNGESNSNIGTFSTYYGINEYQKFFDMGFSYDQKLMYMAYREDDDTYENGGVVVGRIMEKDDENYVSRISYYRDSTNNIEGVEPNNIRYYHQMSEKFEYFRQDCLSGEPYNVLATQIPTINGRDMTFESLNDALERGNTWQSIFMNASSTNIDELTAQPEEYYRMSYTTLTSITSLITSSIEYRTYVDNIKTRHLGETISKNGIYSAFGSFNERDNTLNMTIYLFTNNKTYSSNFSITLKYAPYIFTDDKYGRISTKLSCTEDRLYFSFASKAPANDDVILNGINGDTYDGIGSTKYENVADSYGDSTITILSFNIEEKSVIIHEEDETRYLLKSSGMGYFPQYGGISGKNLMFKNASLSSNTKFPFEVHFDPIGSGDDVRMTRNITVKSSEKGSIGISKFLNLDNKFMYSDVDNSDGIVVADDHTRAFYIPFKKKVFEDDSYMYSFKNVDGRSIFDISRPHINQNTTALEETVIISDGENNSSYIGAIDEFSSNKAPTVKRLPIVSNGVYNLRTDFHSIEDKNDKIYSLHSDGKTISELEIKYRDEGYDVPEYGIISHTLTSTNPVRTNGIIGCGTNPFYVELPEDGYDDYTNDTYAAHTYTTYENNATMVVDMFEGNGNILQYKTATTRENIAPFFINDLACVSVFRPKTEQNSAVFDVDVLNPTTKDVTRYERAFYISPKTLKVKGFEDTTLKASTDGEITKLFWTNSQRVYTLTVNTSDGKLSMSARETDTFDKVVEDGILSSDTDKQNNVEVNVGHSDNYLLFSYYSEEQNAHGMVYCRKDTPSSVGEYCKFTDENGNAVTVNHITKILTNGTTVVAQDEEGDSTSILVSTDGGLSFTKYDSLTRCNIDLVGCGLFKFYAHADNGNLIYSSDGINWVVDATVPFSHWLSLTVKGNQYLVCSKQSNNSSDFIKDRYLEIKKQVTLDTDYTFNKINIDSNDTIIAFSCNDNKAPIKLARFSESNFNSIELIEFSRIRGILFTNSYAYNGSLFLSADGSDKVLKIANVFDYTKEPTCSYIDLSDNGNMSNGTYGGFAELDGSLILYPYSARDIMIYNENSNKFYKYCSVGTSYDIIDCDNVFVESEDEIEAVLTPCRTDSDGLLNLIVTNVSDRNNYGIVEIDEGFPIIVEYSTSEIADGKTVTQFKFIMSIDKNKATATITTIPDVEEDLKKIYRRKSTATVSYTVGEKTLIYTFSTVDDSLKYVITRNSDVETTEDSNQLLSIKFALNDFNRTSNNEDELVKIKGYADVSKCKYYVYDDFEDEKFSKKINDGMPGPINEIVTKFADYVFADTLYFYGLYSKLTTTQKSLVVDSNFAFANKTPSEVSGLHTIVRVCDDMFNGCVNAEMTNSLSLYGSYEPHSAKRMFKDCNNAKLPSIYISNSGIKYCSSMFENCGKAILANVDFPLKATEIYSMFKNCKTADFESITLIPEVNDMNSVFYNCENGTFKKLTFFTITDYSDKAKVREFYNTDYMFYMCKNMNAQNLYLERVLPYIKSCDCMFYGAGINKSNMFNDNLLMFGRVESIKNMFTNSNFEFDNTYIQFHGIDGVLHTEVEYFSIQNNVIIDSIESLFENTAYATKAPTIILSKDDISVENADSKIDGRLEGHYYIDSNNSSKVTGIFNFSSLYKNSSINSIDLRGIANNADMDSLYMSNDYLLGKQNFSSMCENCDNLTEIVGYIPPYGVDYSSMFRNCSNLDIDVSKLFKIHTIVDGEWTVEKAYSDLGIKSYNTSSIAYMFDGCKSLYSSDENFDLAMLVDKCSQVLGRLGVNKDDYANSFENAFGNSNIIVTNSTISDLGSLNFNYSLAVDRRNAIKYAISKDYDSKYGLKSEYIKFLYPNGFLRYCGTFKDDETKFAAVIYYPEKDVNGNVISLAPKTIGKSIGLSPYGFADNYNTIQTSESSTWYGYDYDKLYAAAIFDVNTNKLIKYAYIGEYTLIKHWYAMSSGSLNANTDMSIVNVSIFDGLETTIKPLENA